MRLTYPIVLKRSEEGVAVGCLVLPGCWSQGDTEEEAIEQIQIAIRALRKAGYSIVRECTHTILSNGIRILTIPRHNFVNAFTMGGGIVKDAGLTVDEFKKLL